MNVFGSTRSSVRKDHALITPESFVRSPLPGWDKTEGIILISPQMGARFTQYLALMERGGVSRPALPGVERFVYVLEGEITLTYAPGCPGCEESLKEGGYLFLPAGVDYPLRARTASKLNVFEKRYLPVDGSDFLKPVFGQEQDEKGEPFQGDPDAVLKTLLPDSPLFDLAVNVFTFRPGAALPMVEVHVMEHGLLMLEGQGVYRLGDAWYPVRQGDVIWMAPYCPQWFVAMGKGPARYLYYKGVNRDPMQS
jgi:(S)-ureidoglycine aminohydrolase